MNYEFLTPYECSRLVLKKHIESLPDWMPRTHVRWCMRYLNEGSANLIDSLFSEEADRQFEHKPIVCDNCGRFLKECNGNCVFDRNSWKEID